MSNFLDRRVDKNEDPTYSLVYGEDNEWHIIPTDKKHEWDVVAQWDYYDSGDLPEWAELVDLDSLVIKDWEN